MRVPLGARKCSLNCPPSTAGKKSSPTQRTSRSDETQATRNTAVNTRRPCTHRSSSPRYAARTLTNPRSSTCWSRTNGLRDGWSGSCGTCAFSRYFAIVGTSVRESRYDASIAKTTASAIGTNRYRATPVRKNIGTKTMQMQIVETKAGMAICCAPSRIAGSRSLPCSRCQLMFSIATVASSTRTPTASASPPSVMMLIVSPSALSTMIELRIDSGIETAMMTVLRQLPRKTRIISAVRQAAITASRSTPSIDARTNTDWSASGLTSSVGGRLGRMRGSASLICLMISSVEALPVF